MTRLLRHRRARPRWLGATRLSGHCYYAANALVALLIGRRSD